MNKNQSPLLVLLCLLFVLNGGPTTLLVEGKSNVYIVYLGEKKHADPELVADSHHRLLASVVGSKEKTEELIVYSYKHGFSGFAAKLTESQAQQISDVPGVLRVIPNSLHTLQTTRSWDSLGLVSESQSNLLHRSNKGDGVIIGVFDSGIWPESKSFNEKGLGPIPSRWNGICQPGEQFNATHCSRKIIGARWFAEGILAESGLPPSGSGDIEFLSARDAIGHGTHTASTAAGAPVRNVSYNGLAAGTARGGAPGARIAVYKVCWNVHGGACASADILKAFDEAIHDGVDVVSLSLGASVPLYSDVDERDGVSTGSFHAVAHGISVVCAGGNDGPWARTAHNVAPWIFTVAASSIDRAFLSQITLGNNITLMGQASYTIRSIGFRGLLYSEPNDSDPSASGNCETLRLNQTRATGNIVLCFTSAIRQAVIINAAAVVRRAGGTGLIVAKHPSSALPICSSDFPCIQVDYAVGTTILFYIRSTRVPIVNIKPSRTLVGNFASPKVALFSSRGPNSVAPEILKPDISAPGVNILAATSPIDELTDNGYGIYSGTSMAAPHVSGIVALLKALYPSWSPAAIKSALVTTAWTTAPSGLPIMAEGSSMKPADPFDFGGGILNPNAAADPGLVYDMGASDYIHYLCAMHYNNSDISHLTRNTTNCPIQKPSILDLNLPSITILSIGTTPITVTRTVTNVGAPNSTYRALIETTAGVSVSVKPKVLVFDSRVEKISFHATISTTYRMETGYLFGSLTWSDGVHDVRIPLSLRTEMFQPFG